MSVEFVIPMLCLVAVLVIEYKGYKRRKAEYRELGHFAEFLSDLKNYFYVCKNITESIFRAAERVPGDLRKRLEELSFLLENDAWGITATEESVAERFRYMRPFVIQCRNAIRYGSGGNGTESVFLKNMTELRRDVQEECAAKAAAMYAFAGLGVVTVIGAAFPALIRKFGMVMMQGPASFYNGPGGRITIAAFLLITLLCYLFLQGVRQSEEPLRTGKAGKGKLPYPGFLWNMGRDSEVMELQAMLVLLLDVPGITVADLLDVLCSGAQRFRAPLLRCRDAYGAEDIRALQLLYEEVDYPPFRQMVTRLLMSDRVGLREAFSDLATDRRYLREQLRMRREQERKKKAAYAQIAAFCPMFFLLFAYLILPFLGMSLGQMGELFEQMDRLRMN